MARTPSESASPKPITHVSLVDRVTAELHKAILNGEIVPGSAVSIVDLCDQYAVSHIPVREALRRLESEGLLSLRPGKSALVAPLTEADLTGIYRLRRLIEVDLAAGVPGAITDEALDRAKAALTSSDGGMGTTATIVGIQQAFNAALLSDVASDPDMRVLTLLWKASGRYMHLLALPEVSSRAGAYERLIELASSGSGEEFAATWLARLDASEEVLRTALAARLS